MNAAIKIEVLDQVRLDDRVVSLAEAVQLTGSGPFQLPACGEDIRIFADPEVAVITFGTVLGQTLAVPIPTSALRNLATALLSAKDQVEAASRSV